MNNSVNLFSLMNKTALITGATGYLGQAMSFALAEAGAHVIINARTQDKCNQLVEQLRIKGLSAESAAFDIRDTASVNNFVENLNNKAIDVLINNAYFGESGNIELSTQFQYTESYNITIVAAHKLFTSLLSNLRNAVKEKGNASVINIASMYGIVSPDYRIYSSLSNANPAFYGAAKAALIQWTRYAACEFGKENIRVNAISPGPFPSSLVQQNEPDLITKLVEKVPLNRIGLPNEIKGPVLFLASSASSYVNGTNLVVDGGWTAW